MKWSEKLFTLPGRRGQTFTTFRQADERLGFLHRHFRSIHVGGTNGKGSVTVKIGAVLQHLGYKVGVFTSPHITTYRERIQINGQMIPDAVAEEIIAEVFDRALSFFDVLTLLAFSYFAREKVDFAVIEVGLGGRLDATNVIRPEVAIITSIGYDHKELLGNTLEQIAFEKGGIIKSNVPLVVGPTAVPFFPSAKAVTRELFYDDENRAIARAALAFLGIHSEQGLQERPPCRFEQVGNVIFDVAHNPSAFERLRLALEMHFPGKKFPFYLAFSKDKDWKLCIDHIVQVASEIVFLKTDHPKLVRFPNAQEIIPQEGVVAGSFYIMDAIRSKLKRELSGD